MKIKIDEAGYENFTSFLGVTEFVDGVSVNDVLPRQINLLAAIVRIVDAKTGVQYGPGYEFDAVKDLKAVTEDVLLLTEAGQASAAKAEQARLEELKQAQADEANGMKKISYTQADLEDVADKHGIAGLREIAEPLGIKGTSVAKLIEEIKKFSNQ